MSFYDRFPKTKRRSLEREAFRVGQCMRLSARRMTQRSCRFFFRFFPILLVFMTHEFANCTISSEGLTTRRGVYMYNRTFFFMTSCTCFEVFSFFFKFIFFSNSRSIPFGLFFSKKRSNVAFHHDRKVENGGIGGATSRYPLQAFMYNRPFFFMTNGHDFLCRLIIHSIL
jgi:hypothetical protein